jgi:integrase
MFEGTLPKHGDKPFSALASRHVRRIRDVKGDLPEAANARVKALRQVFSFAIAAGHVERNPAMDVNYLNSGTNGFHSWSLGEVEQFEAVHPIGSSARLALALLLFTGQRGSDVILFGRQHVRDGWLHFTQRKNRNRRPITLDLPLMPALQDVIDQTPCGELTFLVNAFGRPFSRAGFGNRMRKWCDAAGLPHCSAHGLRKAAATRLAELGCSEEEIKAVTGHQTSKEVSRYTKAARQKVLAGRALARLSAAQIVDKTVPLSGSQTRRWDTQLKK